MKILSSKINGDGHYELLVEYEKTVTVRDTAIIPNRLFMASQPGNDKLKRVSDDDYLKEALEALRSKCEDPQQALNADDAARASALIGQTIAKE